jgi:hypothetical protein
MDGRGRLLLISTKHAGDGGTIARGRNSGGTRLGRTRSWRAGDPTFALVVVLTLVLGVMVIPPVVSLV